MKKMELIYYQDETQAVLVGEDDGIKIFATAKLPSEEVSKAYGYSSLRKALIRTLCDIDYIESEREGKEVSCKYLEELDYLPDDAKVSVKDVEITLEDNRKYYRILERLKTGDCFESDIYRDKDRVMASCSTDWEALSDYDKNRRAECYVAEYNTLEEALEVYGAHDVIYDAMNSSDVLSIRKLSGLTRKEFGEKFKIPYRTLQNWELGEREAPEYLVNLLRLAVENNW